MTKPSEWLQEQVKEYEALGASLVGYGIPREDINYFVDFPKCVYAILEIPSREYLLVCEQSYEHFHDGWYKYKVDGHCWWEESNINKLNKESFKLINFEGF